MRKFAKVPDSKLQEAPDGGARQAVIDPDTKAKKSLPQLGSPSRLRESGYYNANIRISASAEAVEWERAQRRQSRSAILHLRRDDVRRPRVMTTSAQSRDDPRQIDDRLPAQRPGFRRTGWECKCGVRQITKAESEVSRLQARLKSTRRFRRQATGSTKRTGDRGNTCRRSIPAGTRTPLNSAFAHRSMSF